ncbi:Acylphosphatase [ANME-1 cluster archaeon GoMg3.2]|nr:Acylphosphatase [ANME-1 cluster archaeon GoMg3.2]
MKRVAITAKGRVQKVGYRDEVEETARKLNVTGFVENVKPYDVRIVAEGEDEHIDLFIKRIKIIKFPIDVESVEVNFDDFRGEFEYFEIKRGEWGEEIVERLDTAGKLLYRSVELGESTLKVAERSVELGEESVEIGKKMLGKQDMMLGKQDETIDAIGGVSERIDRSKEEIVTEISALRDDLRSYMEEKFTRIEHEVEAIKTKIGMV